MIGVGVASATDTSISARRDYNVATIAARVDATANNTLAVYSRRGQVCGTTTTTTIAGTTEQPCDQYDESGYCLHRRRRCCSRSRRHVVATPFTNAKLQPAPKSEQDVGHDRARGERETKRPVERKRKMPRDL